MNIKISVSKIGIFQGFRSVESDFARFGKKKRDFRILGA
jgi:hypothetical protein